jgi:hypothetical protein
MRRGTVDLPLHPGKCPAWLFKRMRPLSKAISQLIINEYGTAELLKRLSDPIFFQALGCIIGFDWHSSGVTTTTCGALKEALEKSMGVIACGGKGNTSKKTPNEIEKHSDEFNLSESKRNALLEATKMTAKVDSSCVQDGYGLYHHSFFFDENGNWAVVQQGLNNADGYARRYHWLQTENFVDSPPEKIAGDRSEKNVLNLVSSENQEAREISVDLVKDNPRRLQKYFTRQMTLLDTEHFRMPERHELFECHLSKKDWETLQKAYEIQPENYKELVSLKGMGKKKLRALALVSKLIHGSELDWNDPVKYSFAHGGKDGFPFPVDRAVYDNTIQFLQDTIQNSGLKTEDGKAALHRLSTI